VRGSRGFSPQLERRRFVNPVLMRFLLVFVVFLAAAGPAGAASVSLEPPPPARDRPVATFRAAPGERNDLTVALGADATQLPDGYGEITFADAGARLTAGTGCRARSTHVVVCKAKRRGVSAVAAYLGDSNDRYRVRNTRDDHAYVRAYGGPGDDRLVGADYNDELNGGRGDDVVNGGVGTDFLKGGRGADVLQGGTGYDQILPGTGLDDIDCGPAEVPNQVDDVYDPEQGEALVACSRAYFRYPDGRYLHLTPNPATGADRGEAQYYIGCPETAEEGQDPVTCTGTLTLSYRGKTIATADVPLEGATIPVFTEAGRQLAQRPGGVRAEAEVSVEGQRLRWTSIVTL
jgi:hypothetical protein